MRQVNVEKSSNSPINNSSSGTFFRTNGSKTKKKELSIVSGGKCTRPHYRLEYSSISEVHKIYDFIYKDATVCLLRKYKKFHEIFDVYGDKHVTYTDYDIPNKV